MRLLVFDTSFSACSVALTDVDGAASNPAATSCFEEMDTGQAIRLMPMIDEVMTRAGVTFDDLDAIATSNGPGTFTGVRIAVATARALALSTGLPVFGFSSLALVAATAQGHFTSAEKDHVIAATMDARRGELYVQLFSNPREPALTPPHILDPRSAARLTEKPVIAVGTGAAIYYKAAAGLGRPVQAKLENLQPDAAFAATVHMERLDPIKPLYLRRPDAKPQTAGTVLRVSP